MQFIPISELQANRHFTEHLQMMTEYFSEKFFNIFKKYISILTAHYPRKQTSTRKI